MEKLCDIAYGNDQHEAQKNRHAYKVYCTLILSVDGLAADKLYHAVYARGSDYFVIFREPSLTLRE